MIRDLSDRGLDLVEWIAKWFTAMAIVFGGMKKGYLPAREAYLKRKREATANEMRAILRPELDQLGETCSKLTSTVEMFQAFSTDMTAIEIWVEKLMVMVKDNHERLNETNDLLTAAGLGSAERRLHGDRRHHDTIILPPLGAERRRMQQRHSEQTGEGPRFNQKGGTDEEVR